MKTTKAKQIKQTTNLDGWANVLTGIGGKKARTSGWTPQGFLDVTRDYADSVYMVSGVLRRLIEMMSAGIVAPGVTIEGDTENELISRWDTLRVDRTFIKALMENSLYGGSLVVMIIDDGVADLTKPLATNIRKIMELRSYDRFQVNVAKYYSEPSKPKFGQPAEYQIIPMEGGSYNIHESRCLKFPGLMVPDKIRLNRNRWGGSVIDWMLQAAQSYETNMVNTRAIIENFENIILKVDGLRDLLGSEEGEKQLVQRAQIMELTKGIAKTIFLDTNEDYSKISSNATGLADLTDRFMFQLSSVSGVPATKLFGRAPQGMNATGEGDKEMWHETATEWRSSFLKDPYERLAEISFQCSEWWKGTIPQWKVVFNPLSPRTTEQDLANKKTQSEIDKSYFEMGVLDPMEIRNSRFGGESYSHDTIIEATENQTTQEE